MSRNIFERTPMKNRRVVVTGVGAVTPLGLTASESFDAAVQGKSGITRITRFNFEGFDAQIAGEVKGFNPDLFIHKKEQKKMDLFIQYAIASAQMALKDSGHEIKPEWAHRTGVYVGAGIGGLPGIENQAQVLRERGPSRITPFFIPMVISNLAAGHISMMTGAKGPNLCLATACATGAQSIGEAALYIRRGLADVMIAGGAESTVSPLAIGGFAAMKALSTRNDQPELASRPFDRDRDGFVLGEGAGILILEDLEHATRRGARIYCELLGYGVSADAHHMTNPSPGGEGAARAMTMALEDAAIDGSLIQYINAHGTSTPAGDEVESHAVRKVLGAQADSVWVSSTKSMTGHLLGAAGAVESVFCVLTTQKGVVPPTINLDNPGEGCDLDYVAHHARERKIDYCMNNSFGFGGTNSSLIFSRLT